MSEGGAGEGGDAEADSPGARGAAGMDASQAAAAAGAAPHGGMTGAAGTGRHAHTLDKLVYMANQIAREFASQRPHDAAEATWDHIWHFWDLRMRALILAHHEGGGAGLSEIAQAAVAKLRGDVRPAPHTKATEFNSAEGGDPDLMSDAG